MPRPGTPQPRRTNIKEKIIAAALAGFMDQYLLGRPVRREIALPAQQVII